MKIRQDFVTNSSSSSFIVGFKDKASVKPTLEKETILGRNFDRVLRDIESHSITKGEAISLFKDEMEWDVRYEIKKGIQDREDMSYREWAQWIKDEENMKIVDEMVKEEVDQLTEEFESKVKNLVDEWFEEFKEKIDGYGYLAVVEYDDHNDDDLEYYVMPSLKCTIERFSHH